MNKNAPPPATRFNLARLRAAFRPAKLLWYPTLRSTNDHAIALRRAGKLFAPAVVLTGRQTAGRGRGSNLWWSPAGVLTVTFVRAIDEHIPPQQLPLLVGLAVRAATVNLTADESIQLKWPNDLLHRDRKLVGILCERIDRCDLIGIGVNVCNDLAALPRGLRDRTTTLSTIAGKPISVTDALLAIAAELDRLLASHVHRHFPTLMREYDQHHALVGRPVTITTPHDEPVTGTVTGVDGQGRLLVRNRAGTHAIVSGQVDFARKKF